MQISFADTAPQDADALAFVVTSAGMTELSARVPEALRSGIASALTQARFTGAMGTSAEFWADVSGTMRRVLIVGAGSGDALGYERAGAALTSKFLTSGVKAAVVDAQGVAAEMAARIGFGARLRSWRWDLYRTKLTEAQRPSLSSLTIVGAGEGADTAWARWSALAEGVEFTRELVTEPGNVIYPQTFVERCQRLADAGVKMRVLDEQEMATLGMGALIGVGQGSVRPPRLLVLEWKGEGAPEGKPVLFVGKGITFDTGGISLKPGAGMEEMKWDMGGAGAVVGTMLALALRKARTHVVAVCALAENMPDGNAQRPGDVVTSLSGQTIEVINTDAEGRLVLCDAMTWAQREFSPKAMVDLATLTGAMIIALGKEHGGLFSNSHELARQLVDAGFATGDKLWRLPLGDAYNKLIDSPIADMKNVGPRDAGSITAAQFLQRFVDEGVDWAHLDIAGMVWADKDGPTWAKGATGYGVRLLDQYIATNHETTAEG